MNLPTSDAIRPALPTPRPRWALALLILAAALSAIPGEAANPYSRVVLFGDSLSDTDNLLRRSNGRLPADPPYWKGRSSNGPVWIEYLVRDTGARLTNRAVGGALSGYGNLGGPYPGLRSQVDSYLRGRSGRADSDALHILWAGSNDFLRLKPGDSADRTTRTAVLNIVTAASQLSAAGARIPVIINLPDLGRTPRAAWTSSPEPATLTEYSRRFNRLLKRDLAATGLKHQLVDSFEILRRVQANPAEHGFSDVRRACLATACARPDRFLFWDSIHPTTRGHAVLARILSAAMDPPPDPPPDPVSNPAPTAGAFLQPSLSGRRVVLEAERFHLNAPAGRHRWVTRTDDTAIGSRAMRAIPNDGIRKEIGQRSRSPRLDYRIRFRRAGEYYVWIRGKAPTAADDSLHVGLDLKAPTTSDRITGFGRGWTWSRATQDGPVARIRISTVGVHTLNLWMREDGLSVDRILLTPSRAYRPRGSGPPESKRE
jgi:phospholipase/lecithinase/hemolysin